MSLMQIRVVLTGLTLLALALASTAIDTWGF